MIKKKTLKKNTSVRLVSHVRPLRYKLLLKPDLEAFVFGGNEVIDIVLDKKVMEITLHSKDIVIKTVSIKEGKGTKFADNIFYNIEEETVTFVFKKGVKKGKAKLSIVFEGVINDHLRGFYRSRYEIDGKTKHIATTQFEATDARRAFPSFDEPAQKAVFDVSLIIPGNHTAISNTLPTSIKEHEGGYKVVEFASTPRMSTYLLAFIIGEFEFIEGYTKDKVQVRVFTTAGKKHQAKFALDVAIKSLEFYNEYFGVAYPLPVLDLIAIPDFESAAMENWGAVTFRETALLVDDEHTSFANKQWVAIVIAHELAHQWFGNLVTMEWWTDLWLNEGFASYMEKICIDNLFPHWKVWDLYLASNRYRNAIEIDSLENSHAIEVNINHPNEINETFDMVSYEKGTAIIRMISEYIGEDKFRYGLRYYLKKHSYKNTKTINLWEAFEKISKKPIKKIMNSWTKQVGFPLITLTNQGKLGLKMKQDRFFSSRIIKNKDKNNKIWQIPILYKTEYSNLNKILLIKKSINFSKELISKININESSFIKVNYDKETLDNLRKNIKENHMGIVDRLGIIRDIFALAEGGYIRTNEALDLSMLYANEEEYIVWTEIIYGINKIYKIIIDEDSTGKYRKYALSLFSPLAKKIGFNKKEREESSYTFLRILAISQAAFYGDKKIIKESQRLFSNRIIKPIDPDMRSTIYNIVAQNGGLKEWNIFKKLYLEEKLQEEKERLSKAMTQFKDIGLLEKTLEFILSKEIRDQDAPSLIASTWNNKEGKDLTWKFIKKNWNLILKRYGEGGSFLSRFMFTLGNHTTLKDLEDAKKFFSKNVAPGAERTLKQAYEQIESNIAWIKDDKKDIENWLNNNF